MTSVLYEFDTIVHGEQKNHFFQFIKGRKLSNIYHSHDFYEFVCFLNGSGTQIVNDKRITLEAKTVMLLSPGDKHCFVEQSEDIEIISLSVKHDHFELLSSVYGASFECFPVYFAFSRIFKLYDIYIENREVSENDCTLILSMLLHAYVHTNEHIHHSSIPEGLLCALEEMKKIENLKKGIPALLALSNYSHSHLTKLMKAHFGIGPKSYINELRLLRAYDDLIWTNEIAEKISEALGFSSYSHFCKIFKDRFSIPPSSLRNGKKQKNAE